MIDNTDRVMRDLRNEIEAWAFRTECKKPETMQMVMEKAFYNPDYDVKKAEREEQMDQK